MASFLTEHYRTAEEKIIRSLTASDLRHRTNRSTGIWLGPLVGLSALFTFLHEDASYSELCLIIGTAGGGLVISCLCLYARLMIDSKAAKDFHFLYWIPTILLTLLFLLICDKAIFVSVPWGIIFGTLSTWGVIQVMMKFPGCFTLGEATIVAHSVILFLISTCTNLPLRYHLPPIHDEDIATVILQVAILYVILIAVLCASFTKLHAPLKFYSLVGLLAIVAYFSLIMLLDQCPVVWMFSFIFSSKERVFMIIYWTVCLVLAGLTILIFVQNDAQAGTSARKIFHVLAVMVYIPGLFWQQTFLYLASGTILAFFILLEILRILNIPPLGQLLQDGFNNFADEKDSIVSLTPLYLLCGLSATLWLPTESMCILALMSGVLTIGVGDTFASVIGSRWGKHQWVGSEKTIEGTLACIIVQLIFVAGFAIFGLIETSLLVRGICSVILTSLVEAHTEQVDNLALPFLMYLCLVF